MNAGNSKINSSRAGSLFFAPFFLASFRLRLPCLCPRFPVQTSEPARMRRLRWLACAFYVKEFQRKAIITYQYGSKYVFNQYSRLVGSLVVACVTTIHLGSLRCEHLGFSIHIVIIRGCGEILHSPGTQQRLVYTKQVNSTYCERWLASSEVISQVLFTSEQPKKNKMAFVGILSQIKLFFGPLVIQLVWYILKQLFT